MTKDISRRFMTIALLVLLAATGAGCVAAGMGTPVRSFPSPAAVPDPHPTAEVN